MMEPIHKQVPLVITSRGLARLHFRLRVLLAAIFYFSTIIILNFVQLASLILKPFSQKAFRSVNRHLAGMWWGWCVIGAEKIIGVELVLTGDDVPFDENALIFANHQQMPDIVVIMMLAFRKKRLGDLKWFVKHALKYVPGIGWGMQFLDCIFLKRDWLADKDKVLATFSRILQYQIPIWLITFVEGTRITPGKLERSREYALKNGLPLLHFVLLPRTRGFTAALEGLNGHIHAVYDMTIGYEVGIPRLYQLYGGAVKKVHLDVRRFPVGELPFGDQECAKWLNHRFVRKDKIMGEFLRTGAFPTNS